MVQDLLRKAVFSIFAAMLCLIVPRALAQPQPDSQSPMQPYATGLVFLSMEKYEVALPLFEQAIRENPRDAKAWLQAGLCLGKVGRAEDKLRAYRKAIALDPGFAEAHYSLGISLLLTGEKCGAVHELRVLRTLDAELAGKLAALIDTMEDVHDCDTTPEPANDAI